MLLRSYQIYVFLNGKGMPFYSSSHNTRDFNHEIRAQSEIRLHREYNLAMKNKIAAQQPVKAIAQRFCSYEY